MSRWAGMVPLATRTLQYSREGAAGACRGQRRETLKPPLVCGSSISDAKRGCLEVLVHGPVAAGRGGAQPEEVLHLGVDSSRGCSVGSIASAG